MALTDLTIRRAKAQDKPYKLYDSHGLFLLVNPSGSKLWRQKFKVRGKERLLTHGAYSKVSLKKARAKRNDVQEQLDAGVDPSVKRKLDKIEAETEARNTFKLVAAEYIPGRKSRDKPVRYDKRRYKRHNRIEIMFGRLKDWRRVATRYDRCPKVFPSAIALEAAVIFWL